MTNEKRMRARLAVFGALLAGAVFALDLSLPLGLALFAIGVTALLSLQRKKVEEELREANGSLQREMLVSEQARKTLQQSEERFRTAVLSTPFPMMIHAEDGEVITINKVWTELTGYEPEEIPRVEDWTQRAYGESRLVVKERIDELYAIGSRIHEGEYSPTTRDGEVLVWEFSSAPLGKLPDGRRTVLSIATDITARKKAEEEIQRLNAELEERVIERTTELRASRQRYRTLAEVAPVGIYHTDREGRCTYVNQKWSQITGLTLEEARVQDWSESLHPEDVDRVVAEWEDSLREGVQFASECRFVGRDGETTWVIGQAKAETDPEGNVVGYVGTITDITARKEAEAALRMTQFAVDHASDAIYWVKADGRIVYANRAASSSLGYSPEELRLMSVSEIDPDYPHDHWPVHWREMKEAGSLTFEAHHQAKDGRVFPVEISTNYLEHEGEEYIWAYVRDITARKKVEAEREKAEKRYRTIFEQLPDAVVIIDPETTLPVEFNELAPILLGYSREEFAQLRVSDYEASENAEETAAHIQKILAVGADEFETTMRTKTGEILNVLVSVRLMNLDGKSYFHSIFRDITERKRADQALKESEERYRSLFNGIPVGLFRSTPQGRFIDLNPAFVEMLGYRNRDELLAVDAMGLYVDKRDRSDMIDRLREEGAALNWLAQLKRADGRIIWVRGDARAVRDQQGEFVYHEGAIRDVTAAIEAENALRRWADIFERIEWGVVVSSGTDDTFELMNPAFARMHGYEVEELSGRPIAKVFAPDCRAELPELLRLVHDRGHHTFETKHIRKDGTVFPVLVQATAVKDETGQVLYRVVNVIDITERQRAEEALRKSEQKFRQLVEQAADAFLLMDLDGRFLDVNQRACDSLGYTREEMLTLSLVDIERGLKPEALGDLRAVAGANSPMTMEGIHRRKDGSRFPVEVRVGVVESGEEKAVLALVRDITDRKRAEEQNRTLAAAVESAGEAIMITDRDAKIRYVNPAFERIHGYRLDEVIGQTPRVLKSGTHPAAFYREMWDRISADEVWTGTITNKRRDGSLVDVEQTISPVVDATGTITGFVAVERDITERKRAEQALRESEEKYRSLFASETDAIVIADGESLRVVDVNEAACRLYGYGRDEFLKLEVTTLSAEPEASKATLRQLGAKGRAYVPFTRHRKKDGTVFPAALSHGTFMLQGRQMICGIFRDISRRVQAEEKARQHQDELAHVSRVSVMGEMATGLAHELNQPLSAIVNYSRGCVRRLQSGAPATPELLSALENISDQAERAGKIVQGIRSFVGKTHATRSAVNLNEAAGEVAQLVESDAIRSGVRIELDLDPSLPEVRVESIQIQQVILNLLRNAIEAMEETPEKGRKLILKTAAKRRDMIEVGVQDHGSGFSAEAGRRAFEPFFTTKSKGMGLGLSISRSIVEAHGGKLSMSPVRDGGTLFQFTLPIAQGADDEEA